MPLELLKPMTAHELAELTSLDGEPEPQCDWLIERDTPPADVCLMFGQGVPVELCKWKFIDDESCPRWATHQVAKQCLCEHHARTLQLKPSQAPFWHLPQATLAVWAGQQPDRECDRCKGDRLCSNTTDPLSPSWKITCIRCKGNGSLSSAERRRAVEAWRCTLRASGMWVVSGPTDDSGSGQGFRDIDAAGRELRHRVLRLFPEVKRTLTKTETIEWIKSRLAPGAFCAAQLLVVAWDFVPPEPPTAIVGNYTLPSTAIEAVESISMPYPPPQRQP